MQLRWSKSLGIHLHGKHGKEERWILPLSTNKARRLLHVPRKRKPSLPPSPTAWMAVIVCPRAAPPDSGGLETIPPPSFHSKWELCSIHHLHCNYSQRISPFHSPSDQRLQATTWDIFLPVASYFHNMNVVKCMVSKLPLGEEYPIPLLSLAFSSNSHYTWIYKHPLSSWGLLFWSSGFSWNTLSSSWLEIMTSVYRHQFALAVTVSFWLTWH